MSAKSKWVFFNIKLYVTEMANSECLNIVLLVRMLEVKETKAGRLRMTNYFWRKGIFAYTLLGILQ